MSTTKSASAPNVIFNESPSATATVKALEHEAATARAAMSGAFTDLQHHLQTAADPREWAQRRPWMALGAAAAAGFVAAGMFTRERKAPSVNGAIHAAAAVPPSGPTWTGLVIDLVRVFLTSQLLPMVQAWMQSTSNPGNSDEAAGADDASPASAAPQGEMAT